MPASVMKQSDWSQRWQTKLPGWLLSVGIHLGLLYLLLNAVRVSHDRPLGVEEGPDRVVGLVSRQFQPGPIEQAAPSESVPDRANTQPDSHTNTKPTTNASDSPIPDATAPVPLDLPRETIRPRTGLAMGQARAAAEPANPGTVVQGTASSGDAPSGSIPADGAGRATFFGASARGQKVVYVVDASGSMADFGAMSVAKGELLASLERLAPDQRFQIIFYNNTPHPMAVVTGRSGMPPATAIEKEKARQFIRGQQPGLGTVHIDALRMALDVRPDVIFLLTDAGTAMSFRDLETVRKLNGGGCQIHAIEFGRGGDLTGDENFLKKLARQNSGQHRYRDVEKFVEKR